MEEERMAEGGMGEKEGCEKGGTVVTSSMESMNQLIKKRLFFSSSATTLSEATLSLFSTLKEPFSSSSIPSLRFLPPAAEFQTLDLPFVWMID